MGKRGISLKLNIGLSRVSERLRNLRTLNKEERYIGAKPVVAESITVLIWHRGRENTEKHPRSLKQPALSWSRGYTVPLFFKKGPVSQLAAESWSWSHPEVVTLQEPGALSKHGILPNQVPAGWPRVYLAERERNRHREYLTHGDSSWKSKGEPNTLLFWIWWLTWLAEAGRNQNRQVWIYSGTKSRQTAFLDSKVCGGLAPCPQVEPLEGSWNPDPRSPPPNRDWKLPS